MPNIMKIVDVGHNKPRTVYIMQPHKIIEIYDRYDSKPSAEEACVSFSHGAAPFYCVKGINARNLKRDIQEKIDVPMGFLKMTYVTPNNPKARFYVNVERIAAIEPQREDANKTTLTIVGGLDDAVKVDATPFDVAFQVRRVLKKLEQDEEFCCSPPVEPALEEDETE